MSVGDDLTEQQEIDDSFVLESATDEVEEQTLADIFKNVTINEDIILVIDAGAEEFLRRGLAAIKYKANKAARDAGVEVDQRSLEFKILAWTEVEKHEDPGWEGKSKVQVYLKSKQSIRVHRLTITDKEF
jgi:hypothetical protein